MLFVDPFIQKRKDKRTKQKTKMLRGTVGLNGFGFSRAIVRGQGRRTLTKLSTPYTLESSSNTSGKTPVRVELTLFSKDNCQLCDKAMYVLEEVYGSKPEYRTQVSLSKVDINNPLNKEWWDKYCFDVPVLHVVSSSVSTSGTPSNVGLQKIFHKLDEQDVIEKIEKCLQEQGI